MSALAEKQHLVAKVGARKAGTSVTMSSFTPGTYDATTDTAATSATATMTGMLQRVPGDPKRYEALGLTEAEAPSFQWTPDTYGDTPALGATFTFGSTAFTVRDVQPWAPDGNTVSCRVVAVR